MKTVPVTRVSSGAPWEKKVGYCRAIRSGAMIAVSGTIATNPEGKVHATGNGYEQAKRCLETIENALIELGADRKCIIRTRLFVTDISLWEEFGRAHAEFFKDAPPATSMLEISQLIHPDFLIEIEADAHVGT